MAIHLALHGLNRLSDRVQSEVLTEVRHQFEPLVNEAGAQLILTTGNSAGDLSVDIDTTAPVGVNPCQQLLGIDGSGVIWVKSHRNLRVCDSADPKTGRRDLRRLLTTDWLLGRALTNTIIHELGHAIANLGHTSDPTNYMFTWGLEMKQRTLKTQRRAFAGKETFDPDQRAAIVNQLRVKQWLGN
jgi:hypothetical protein